MSRFKLPAAAEPRRLAVVPYDCSRCRRPYLSNLTEAEAVCPWCGARGMALASRDGAEPRASGNVLCPGCGVEMRSLPKGASGPHLRRRCVLRLPDASANGADVA